MGQTQTKDGHYNPKTVRRDKTIKQSSSQTFSSATHVVTENGGFTRPWDLREDASESGPEDENTAVLNGIYYLYLLYTVNFLYVVFT